MSKDTSITSRTALPVWIHVSFTRERHLHACSLGYHIKPTILYNLSDFDTLSRNKRGMLRDSGVTVGSTRLGLQSQQTRDIH